MEERKNLCAMLPVALHTRVRQEQEKAGMTLGEYVEAMITEYYDWKDGKIMTGEMRTLCSRHAADTAACGSHYYSEARIYDGIITMINKLRFCEEDILGQTIQKLEFAAAAYKRNNRAASLLSQSIAELNAKLLALERLRTKGYLATDIYHTQAREIRQQLDKLKTERYSSFESKILTMLEDVRKLKSLIDELEQPLEVFDEKLFHEIVTDICINNHDEMTVTLLGGLRFTEQI